jgi:putative membrane protein
MATHDFFTGDAQRKVTEAIARAEQRTSAEVVVALRRASSNYRAASLLFAALAALATLLVMVFAPTEFPLWGFALDAAIVFAFAMWVAGLFPPIQRGLTPDDDRARTVREAAAATFLARGVHRCKARNGLLVYVSMLEQQVEFVADIGIDRASIESAHKSAQSALLVGDVGAFVTAIESIGELLGPAHPRSADDVNELADEVDASN